MIDVVFGRESKHLLTRHFELGSQSNNVFFYLTVFN